MLVVGLMAACTRHIDLPEISSDAAVAADAGANDPDAPEQWMGEPTDGPRADARPPAAGRGDAGQVSALNACATDCPFGLGRTIPEEAQVIIALDRSFSMFEPGPASMPSRNEVVYQALSSLLRQYRAALDFGYIEFPGAPSMCPLNTCCAGYVLSGSTDIERRLRCETSPGDCFRRSNDTPVAEALRRCADYFESDDRFARRQKQVVVLTDGEPSCASTPPDSWCQHALGAVSRLSRDGVRTSVIALAEGLRGNACIEGMAQVGATGGSPIVATDAAQVRGALAEMFERLSFDACRFMIGTGPVNADRVQVYLRDTKVGCLPRDPARRSGWDFDGSPQFIRIYGLACDAVRRGALAVEAVQCR